ncbi:hypothetical protein AB0F46_39210 [Streptomyces sp. NPDC026665]|uniref:hypothetical protein n=1 Tax=Streptomyces sp. NPDC026665 TaxID=3154798 RepID=UPI0033D938E2
MELSELEKIGRIVTRMLAERDDAAVGAGLALHKHGLIGRPPSESCVDVYGSEEAYSRLRTLVEGGLVRYHVTDIEFHPSVKDGIRILSFEDAVRFHAERVAKGAVSRDFSYMADICKSLGPRGVDGVLATSRLASSVSVVLSMKVGSEGYAPRHGTGSLERGYLRDLSEDLKFFEAASVAAEARMAADVSAQKSLDAVNRATMARVANDRRQFFLKPFGRIGVRKLESKARDSSMQSSLACADADRVRDEFKVMIAGHLRDYRGINGRVPGTRREGVAPSTPYGKAYAKVVDRGLQAPPAYPQVPSYPSVARQTEGLPVPPYPGPPGPDVSYRQAATLQVSGAENVPSSRNSAEFPVVPSRGRTSTTRGSSRHSTG